MAISDRMTRTVTAVKALGATSVSFASPERPLISGEYVVFSGHSTEYAVSAPTSTSFTVSPALTAAIAVDEKITRFDKYSIADLEDIIDYIGLENSTDLGLKTQVYKLSIEARKEIEKIIGSVVFRTKTFHRHITENDNRIILPYLNIESITSITIDDEVVDSDDYVLDDGGVIAFGFDLNKGSDISIVAMVGVSDKGDLADLHKRVTKILFDRSRQGKDMFTVSANVGVANPELNQTFRDPKDLRDFILDELQIYRQILV